jgi:hypothetical protein
MGHTLPVQTRPDFTSATGTAEADHGRELGPIDEVEKAVLAPDWHGRKWPRLRSAWQG